MDAFLVCLVGFTNNSVLLAPEVISSGNLLMDLFAQGGMVCLRTATGRWQSSWLGQYFQFGSCSPAQQAIFFQTDELLGDENLLLHFHDEASLLC